MILPIIAYGAAVLKQKAATVDLTDPALPALIANMWETMYASHGVGLAAPQVNISKQIIVFRNPDNEMKDKIEITPLINPSFTAIG
ncbi:MAG: peptide deformylase, partial [Flavobacteriaceae bacterium]